MGGQELFEVHSASFLPADERAASLSQAILDLAKSVKARPEDLHAVHDNRIKGTLLMCGKVVLGSVWDYEAEALGMEPNELAQQRLEIIRQAMVDYRHDFSSGSIIKAVIFAAVATVVLIVLLLLISRLRTRLENTLANRIGNKTLFKILNGETLVNVFHLVNRLVHFSLIIWLVLAYLNVLLSLFPWTYSIAAQVYEYVAGPLRTFGAALVAQIPSFFFLALIVVITVFTLRGVRFFFNEIERGRIKLRGFYSEWSRPTFNIIRLVIVAFSIVVAFPYIPGSGSMAFKGVTIFMGLLVSLGSSSAMANIVSGIILIYMRPFAIGDRIQIGTTIGDVVDRNLLTTRIRTPKNERVTIPNTNILSGQIINFTAKARTTNLILHTSITIGYDVPWRQVHGLMIDAAKSTENVLPDPEPFVLQTALHDFYIEYEINAYTDKPRQTPATYSKLHQNIQDKFNEAGVEIMSPHFRVNRRDDLVK